MITNTKQKEKTFVLPIIFDQNVCGEREILRMHFFTFQKKERKMHLSDKASPSSNLFFLFKSMELGKG